MNRTRKRIQRQSELLSPQKSDRFASMPFPERESRQSHAEKGRKRSGLPLTGMLEKVHQGIIGRVVQAKKLAISETSDPHEKEADRIAKVAVKGSSQNANNGTVTNKHRGNVLQKKGSKSGGMVSRSLETQLNRQKGSGESLDPQFAEKMGSVLGTNLSEVRIHTDSKADKISRKLQAKAFTTGQDIYFQRGEYNPKTESGQELIAHEVTHAAQQQSNNHAVEMVQRKVDMDWAKYQDIYFNNKLDEDLPSRQMWKRIKEYFAMKETESNQALDYLDVEVRENWLRDRFTDKAREDEYKLWLHLLADMESELQHGTWTKDSKGVSDAFFNEMFR